MIQAEQLVKDFGARRAVDEVSFEVGRGVVLGFLGPNGAGKTTTMRMLTGFLEPTSGRVEVNGCEVARSPVEAKRQIGYLPENAPLYEEMTVESFLRFIAEMRGFHGADKQRRVDEVIEKYLLEPVRYQSVDTLSKGYRQRTCFAQALLHDPPVLILDEPTEGLDPNQKQVVRGMIREMGRDKTIILSTHVLEEVEAICSRVIIISNGRLVADSTPLELKKQSRTFNRVILQIRAPAAEAAALFRALPEIREVHLASEAEPTPVLHLYPRNGEPITGRVLEAAKAKGWPVESIHTDGGRLDDVFRKLTVSEDVNQAKSGGSD